MTSRTPVGMAILAVAMAAVWGPAASAGPRVDGRLEPDLVPVPIGSRGDLRVDVWTIPGEGSWVYPGEDVEVRFRVSEDAYVVVYNVDTRGRIRRLYPEEPWDEGYVPGGCTVRLPGRHAGYRLTVTGPAGIERIVAVASERPFPEGWLARAEARGAVLDRNVPHGLADLASRPARGSLEPNLVPVPVRRGGFTRDETWLRVGRVRYRY